VLRCLRLSVLLCLAWLTGCATTESDWTAGWTPEKLYAEARDEMDNKAYEKAIKLYEKLEGRAAGTQLAQQAQLEKAYAYFKNGEPVLADVHPRPLHQSQPGQPRHGLCPVPQRHCQLQR